MRWQLFQEWLDRFLVPIDDPGSRLFHLNILLSLAFIAIWILIQTRHYSPKEILGQVSHLVFRKKYWWNRSTRLDYKIYFINSVLKVLLFIPFLDFSFRFSKWTVEGLSALNNHQMASLNATPLVLFVFSVAAFVFDDFLRFIHHYWMHKIPFLWRLHKTHHSAKILTPISLYRTHPLESAMATIRNSLSTGVAVGVFIFLFESHFSVFTILGVNLFGFLFNLLGSNLRHSHIPISFGFMESIFISPKQHQIHHSTNPEHFNKNFGVSLSFWDKVGGSVLYSSQAPQRLRFGLNDRKQSLRKNLFYQ